MINLYQLLSLRSSKSCFIASIQGWLIIVLLFDFNLAASSQLSELKNQNSTTSHTLLDSENLSYATNAKVGDLEYKTKFSCIPVKTKNTLHAPGRMCYTEYMVESTTSRPVTFLFNGGPGAASVFLHFGVAGPQIIKIKSDQNKLVLPTGAHLVDNPDTWLQHTDLVFVDPIGTGYSHIVPVDPPANKQEELAIYKNYWGIEEDLDSLADLIRKWISSKKRWGSTIIIGGESYGGLRTAGLAHKLMKDYNISISGALLISPALSYKFLGVDAFGLASWVTALPSMIETARYHNKADLSIIKYSGTTTENIEQYIIKEYLPAIAQGNKLKQSAREKFFTDLAKITGLPRTLISQKDGLLTINTFSKNILRSEGLQTSIYDGMMSFPAPYPRSTVYNYQDDYHQTRVNGSGDIFLTTVSIVFNQVANQYYLSKGVSTDKEFYTLNQSIVGNWNFPQDFSAIETFNNLVMGARINPDLKVLIVHGRHDLVTPYYASQYLINRSDLKNARERLELKIYDGGHMFYLAPESLRVFNNDIKNFYRNWK